MMSYSEDKLDEIRDILVDVNYKDPAWGYAVDIMEDELNYDIMDLLNNNKQSKFIKYIQKKIKMALEDLKAIDDMAIQDGINTVREKEGIEDDVEDDEIKKDYEDEVHRYAEGSRNMFEEDFTENWEKLIKAIGDFRDEYDLERRIRNFDDRIIETVSQIEEVYKEETRGAFMEVFNG
ncbi:MAG: hypothetical protein ACOCRX_10685 [Candidatus Woesearchaeota archaeon]